MDSKEFVLDVWDHDAGCADDWIGHMKFNLHASFTQGSKKIKENIRDRKDKVVGEVEINIKVYRISGKIRGVILLNLNPFRKNRVQMGSKIMPKR